MSEWQPIETAPKDGAWVLMYYPRGGGWDFEAEVDVPLMVVMRQDERGFWHSYYKGIRPEGEPTHWTPLPEPPKA